MGALRLVSESESLTSGAPSLDEALLEAKSSAWFQLPRRHAAADAFFGGAWEGGEEEEEDDAMDVDEDAVDKWFERLKDPASGNILDDGIEQFCTELGIDTQDPAVLTISWAMEAKEMCCFTREEWRTGMRKMGADSPERLCDLLPALAAEVADPRSKDFKRLYAFAFDFAREGSKKTIGLDEAMALWQILLAGKEDEVPLLKDFIAFLRRKADEAAAAAAAAAKAAAAMAAAAAGPPGSQRDRASPPPALPAVGARITKDTWTQALDFLLLEDLSKYDANDAWPVTVDDFVEDQQKREKKA